jgi:hypothetical protein
MAVALTPPIAAARNDRGGSGLIDGRDVAVERGCYFFSWLKYFRSGGGWPGRVGDR